MKKESLLHLLIYGNKAVVICIVFTIATILDMVVCVMFGIMDISYWHLGMRFLLCIFIVLSLYIFNLFDKLPIYVMLIIHFAISVLIMLTWVWITSFYDEVHPNAYRDAARTIVIIYPVIITGSIVIDGMRTAKANRILKKRFDETNS